MKVSGNAFEVDSSAVEIEFSAVKVRWTRVKLESIALDSSWSAMNLPCSAVERGDGALKVA